jgi:hypothetical protein
MSSSPSSRLVWYSHVMPLRPERPIKSIHLQLMRCNSNVLSTLVEAGLYITAITLHRVKRAPTLSFIRQISRDAVTENIMKWSTSRKKRLTDERRDAMMAATVISLIFIPLTGSRSPHIFSTIYSQMAVRSALRAGHLLPPGRFLVLISITGWVDPRAIVRLEGLGQLENPVTLLGIEPATFRLVA